MKTIGLIGGMSWQSSKVYYEYFNQIVEERLGGSHSAKILLSSLDFAEIEKLSFKDDWNGIGEIMAEHAKKLQHGSADVLLIGSNTINMVSDHVTRAVETPFIHIAHATGQAIAEKGLKKIGLLGTKFTMEKDFYTRILSHTYDIETVIPESDSRQILQDIIYNELVKGVFTEASKKACLEIIENLIKRGAQGIILGCTELPLLIPDTAVSTTTFDTTLIHATKAVDFALNQ